MTLLAFVPVAALLPAALVDRGPSGQVRGTLFPAALVLLDDLTWECIRPSVLAAGAAALVSLGLGVAFGSFVARWRFWGQGLLIAAVGIPLAVPPLFGAIGVRALLGDVGNLVGWCILVLLATLQGMPLVLAAVMSALDRVDPAWEEGARAAGASPWRIGCTLTWPLVRPSAARATALVFANTLLEPGAPLALGLRRSLAYQIADAAMHDDAPTRAAILLLLGCAMAWAIRTVLALRGREADWPTHAPRDRGKCRRAPWPRATVYCGALTTWAGLAATPVWGLLSLATSRRATSGTALLAELAARLGTPERVSVLGHSLGLGAATAVLALLLACVLAGRNGFAAFTARLEAIPALATAVGLVALPWLLEAAGLPILAHGLDAYRTPGLTLLWAVVVVRLPLSLRAVAAVRECWHPRMLDAAVTLGATRRQARWSLFARLAGPTLLRAGFLTAALAASSVGPALILAPTSASLTLGPAVLFLAENPDGAPAAAALALLASAVNLLVLGCCAREIRSRPVAA
jgi:ABC-type Fe3+ transport system permease subunit